MKICVISGTNRPGSNTRKVAGKIAGDYGDLGVEVEILDLLELPTAIFSPTAYAEKPAAFLAEFADRVLSADGLVVVTPEYNGAMPGVLKLFIDMLKFPESFEGRPVAFVGLAAGMWGGMRSVEHLQQIFAYRHAHLFPVRVFIPGVGGVIDADTGEVGAEIAGRLEAQAKGFVEYVERLKG